MFHIHVESDWFQYERILLRKINYVNATFRTAILFRTFVAIHQTTN